MADGLTVPSFAPGGMPPGGGGPPGTAPSPEGPVGFPAGANPESLANLELVRGIVKNASMLAQKIPGAVDIVRQINDLTQKLQMKIMQTGPAPQAQAPPVA